MYSELFYSWGISSERVDYRNTLHYIEAYIAHDNPSAADDVVLKILKAVSLLKEQPGLGRAGRVPGTKELVVPKIPYIVPYRVKGDFLQILRVYHTSRTWPRRM